MQHAPCQAADDAHLAAGRLLQVTGALDCILLDWRIWSRAPPPHQRSYFAALLFAISGHVECAHHRALLRDSNVAASLLSFVTRSRDVAYMCPHESVVPLLFDCVTALLLGDGPLADGAVQLLCNFVLDSFDAMQGSALCEHHSEARRMSTTSSSPTLGGRRRGSVAPSSTIDTAAVAARVREAALSLLARCCVADVRVAACVLRELPEPCLTHLVRDGYARSRVAALALLDVCVPSLAPATWAALAASLARFAPTEDSLLALFAMLLGRPVHALLGQSIRASLLGTLHSGDPFVRAQALVPLLRQLTGCHVDPALAQVTVKTLHDAFLHSSAVRKQMHAVGAPLELCRVVVSAASHSTCDGGDDDETLQADTMALLQALVLRGLLSTPADSAPLLCAARELCAADPALLARLLVGVLDALRNTLASASGEDGAATVAAATTVLGAWVAQRRYADVDVAELPQEMDARLLDVALGIAHHAGTAAYLRVAVRCWAQMACSSCEALWRAALRVLDAHGAATLAALCSAPDAAQRVLFAVITHLDADPRAWALFDALRQLAPMHPVLDLLLVPADATLHTRLAAHDVGAAADVVLTPSLRYQCRLLENEDTAWAAVWAAALPGPPPAAGARDDAVPAALLERQLTLQGPWLARLRSVEAADTDAARHAKRLGRAFCGERGLWPDAAAAHPRWVLDGTEGPARRRLRLKPVIAWQSPAAAADLSLDVSMSSLDTTATATTPSTPPPETLVASAMRTLKMHHGESIVHLGRCSMIHPYEKRAGELVVTTARTVFMDAVQDADDPLFGRRRNHVKRRRGKVEAWSDSKVMDLQLRRYLLRDTGLEVFLIDGRTFLVAFETRSDRDAVYAILAARPMPSRVAYEVDVVLTGTLLRESVTAKWQRGLISTFEYLMHLNTLAGRSYNDLTQYPVFPWIVADYTSAELNLRNTAATFRRLDRPMGAQTEPRLQSFLEKYDALVEMGQTPYHYGSHYSNVGVVLHYLVRCEPFASFCLQFQGGHFDVADRLFDSVEAAWRHASAGTASDVKECIPEFFYFPDFLRNDNHFDLGRKQTGEVVDAVRLPPWAQGSARLFVRKMREALESDVGNAAGGAVCSGAAVFLLVSRAVLLALRAQCRNSCRRGSTWCLATNSAATRRARR